MAFLLYDNLRRKIAISYISYSYQLNLVAPPNKIFGLQEEAGEKIKQEETKGRLGKGARKKKRKKCGLLPNWGGAGSRMVVKCQTSILEKYFFS